jgi:molybdate transport system substrate-binding protein
MTLRYASWIAVLAALSTSCGTRLAPQSMPKLTVAAAANLTDVFAEVGQAFKAKTGIDVIFSYGATAQLSQQIENGAPFDLFASADTQHIDSLVAAGKLIADTRAVYATGQLVLWSPKGERFGIHDMKDLARPEVRFIAIAQPELAPYGRAAVEALQHAGLWDALKPKVVYAPSIRETKQLAESLNADAAFIAFSLVLHDQGTIVKVDPNLYDRIDQALAIVASSTQIEAAKQFRTFLLGPDGRTIFSKSGYLIP